jgi:dienelactone hydrolase
MILYVRAPVAIVAVLAAVSSPATRAQTLAATTDPATLFGSQEGVIAPELSPDGKRIAYIAPGAGLTTVVVVYDLATRKFTGVTRADGLPMRMKHCGWSAPERLVCEGYGLVRNADVGQADDRRDALMNSQGGSLVRASAAVVDNNVGGVLAPFTRLMALDVDGKNLVALGRRDTSAQLYVRQYDGQVVDWLKGQDGTVLMTRLYVPEMSTGRRTAQVEEGFGVDLLDTRSVKATVVERPKPNTRYISDGQGVVRLMTVQGVGADDQLTGDETHFYRRPRERDWRELGDKGLAPLAVDSAINAAYVLEKLNGRKALYRIALDGTRKAELVFEHPTADVIGVVTVGRSGRVIGARYVTDRPHVEYFGADYRQLAAVVAKGSPRFPDIEFVSASADEQVLLIHASYGGGPGRYLVFDRANNRLSDVLSARPDLDNAALGSMREVHYAAADGTALTGYLTLPPGADKRAGLPAIVVPPGGLGAHDAWGFNWLVQFYASRGFAVLQPNYRGSAGYGDEWFVANGFRNWPLAVGDVNDGAHWLVSEGIADPSKLAIAGWSFGGYVALQANVVDPNLFKAVVAIAPVTDLEALGFQRRGVNTERLLRQYIGTGPHIDSGSPARHAAQFKAPVLMFHGDLDLDVDVSESTDMNKALLKAGRKSDVIVYPNLDHDLADNAARADVLRRSYEFLRSSLNWK